MNRKAIGFSIIVLTLIVTAVWEFWGRENISYKEVIVLKNDLMQGTVVSKEDFEIKRVEHTAGSALTEEDTERLTGMETAQYVAAGTELRDEYFQESEFQIGKQSGRALMALPKEWLLSLPQTVRRGDKITLFNGSVKLMDAVVAHSKDSSGQEVLSADNQRLEATSPVFEIEIIGENDKLVELAALGASGIKFTVITER